MLKCCLFGFQISPGCKNAKLYAQFWNPVEIFWNYIFQLLKCKVKIDWCSIHTFLALWLSHSSLPFSSISLLILCKEMLSAFVFHYLPHSYYSNNVINLFFLFVHICSFFFLFIHPYLFLLFLLIYLRSYDAVWLLSQDSLTSKCFRFGLSGPCLLDETVILERNTLL